MVTRSQTALQYVAVLKTVTRAAERTHAHTQIQKYAVYYARWEKVQLKLIGFFERK